VAVFTSHFRGNRCNNPGSCKNFSTVFVACFDGKERIRVECLVIGIRNYRDTISYKRRNFFVKFHLSFKPVAGNPDIRRQFLPEKILCIIPKFYMSGRIFKSRLDLVGQLDPFRDNLRGFPSAYELGRNIITGRRQYPPGIAIGNTVHSKVTPCKKYVFIRFSVKRRNVNRHFLHCHLGRGLCFSVQLFNDIPGKRQTFQPGPHKSWHIIVYLSLAV